MNMSLKNAKWAKSPQQARYQQWRSLSQAAPNEAPTPRELKHMRWPWGFTGICWEQHYGKIEKFCISFPGLSCVGHIRLPLSGNVFPRCFFAFFPLGAAHASSQQRPPQNFSSFPSSPQVSLNLCFLFHPIFVRVAETSQHWSAPNQPASTQTAPRVGAETKFTCNRLTSRVKTWALRAGRQKMLRRGSGKSKHRATTMHFKLLLPLNVTGKSFINFQEL